MKFAHFADAHIGSRGDPKLSALSVKAFEKTIDYCIQQNVNFILISGDLFDTSLPPIDKLKSVVIKLKQLKQKKIPVYVIAGSHDFSPSGKTMLAVLEEAGLFINVAKTSQIENNKLKLDFTMDPSTGAKITGMLGLKGMLEKNYYELLDRESLEKEQGYKIFMFHTALTELKPKGMENMESAPLSYLPRGFDYYAGGHVHIIKNLSIEGYNNITYPGALFPNNFKEIEEFQKGGVFIVEDGKIDWHEIKVVNVHSMNLDCNHKTPQYVEEEIKHDIKNLDFSKTIVTIRLKGVLESGKVTDINFKEIIDLLNERNAYFIMKNTRALTTKEFEEIKIDSSSVDDIEDTIVNEHIGQINIHGMDLKTEKELTKSLIKTLDVEKLEGQKTSEFEQNIKENIYNVLCKLIE